MFGTEQRRMIKPSMRVVSKVSITGMGFVLTKKNGCGNGFGKHKVRSCVVAML